MSNWPKPARDAALHGPAVEFVTLTAPHTEVDPMALLAQFLVAFGAAADRHVHYTVGAREIDRALGVLEEAGRLRRATIIVGPGRPTETRLPATQAA
jgi:hypothetical protein